MNLTDLSTRHWPSVAAAVALVALFGLTSIASLPIQLLPNIEEPQVSISNFWRAAALVLRQDGSFVFRINEENKAERIAVSIGDSSGDLVGVEGLLAEGDRVAVRGAENLREGIEVRIMMSSSGATTSTASEGA